MNETQPIPWKRVAVEATTIIVSILLAFSIDAWWQERGERNAELMLLDRLRADFVEMRTTLEAVEKEHRAASEACIALLNYSAGESLPATYEVDKMVALVFLASRTFNPGAGAIAAFLNSEGAKLIRNQPLADLLLIWPGLVEELQEEEANLQKGVAERWTPFLASRANVAPYLVSFGELMAGIPGQVSQPSTRKANVVDHAFLNLVLDRYKWQQIALRDIEPLHAAADNILRLLDIELGR